MTSVSPPSSSLRPGDVIGGRYRLGRRLGRGGSATIFAATVAGRSGRVAVKLMHAHDPTGTGRRRFEQEAALLTALRHPHVVPILDVGFHTTGQPYLVMPLVKARSIKQLIADEAPLSPARVVKLGLQVLDALITIHEAGVHHRDIKPDNLLVEETAEGERVLLIDFGFARVTEPQHRLTQMGARLGTPRYMAPEMARAEEYTDASDLYALALVLGEMLTGRPLADGRSPATLVLLHASSATLPLPPEVLDSPLGPVLQRGLAKGYDIRYHTAVQMRADLEAVGRRLERQSLTPLLVADLAPTQVALPAPVLPDDHGPESGSEASLIVEPIPLSRRPSTRVAVWALLAMVGIVTGYLLAG